MKKIIFSVLLVVLLPLTLTLSGCFKQGNDIYVSANLKNVAEKYQLIKALWADLAPKNKLQQEQNEEEKARIIKRRLRLFKDKNKTSKEYFKELITF